MGTPFAGFVDVVWAALIPPLAVWILLSGLDDLVLVAALARAWVRRRQAARPGDEELRARPEKGIAILVPLWREHEVIGRMVEHNLAAIRYRAYDFFLGVYPNDPATIEAVRDLESRFPNVHLALCPHNGPTSKADCLNWICREVRRREDPGLPGWDIVVTHDAEDVIHPDSLLWINWHCADHDMVQIPVLPLPTPLRRLTHGVYCDEFAEYQTKDIPVREMLGGFIPSNGVGTGYTRAALDKLANSSGGRVFDPACLTEDYENGLRLRLAGCRQTFLASTHWREAPVATREYFPDRLRDAIRQRTRWVTGIALQGWQKHGWCGGLRQIYWLWRDRKGLAGNPLTVVSNLMFLWGLAGWAESRARGGAWRLPGAIPPEAQALLAASLLLPLAHLGVRMVCVGRLYGWRFAAGVPPRTVWANWINCAATLTALWRYSAARLRRRPLAWQKTRHAYPCAEVLRGPRRRLGEILVASGALPRQSLAVALESLPPGFRLGEYLVERGLAAEQSVYEALSLQQGIPLGPLREWEIEPNARRALPVRFTLDWKVLPFKILAGHLFLASCEPPSEALETELRRRTRLQIRFQLVTASNFAQLAREPRPRSAVKYKEHSAGA